MANTVLCGSISYEHTVKENEDNTELEISTDIHSDMNGTEKNFNFPTTEFAMNSVEVTLNHIWGRYIIPLSSNAGSNGTNLELFYRRIKHKKRDLIGLFFNGGG